MTRRLWQDFARTHGDGRKPTGHAGALEAVISQFEVASGEDSLTLRTVRAKRLHSFLFG